MSQVTEASREEYVSEWAAFAFGPNYSGVVENMA